MGEGCVLTTTEGGLAKFLSDLVADYVRMSSHQSNASASGDSTGNPDTTDSLASSRLPKNLHRRQTAKGRTENVISQGRLDGHDGGPKSGRPEEGGPSPEHRVDARQYMYTCTYTSRRRRLRASGGKGKWSPPGRARPEPIIANALRRTTK